MQLDFCRNSVERGHKNGKTKVSPSKAPKKFQNNEVTYQAPSNVSVTRLASNGDGKTISFEIKDTSGIAGNKQVNFTVKDDVIYDEKVVIAKNTPVSARVETITKSGMNGIPASIIIGDFKIKNVEKGQLTKFYEVEGQDRSIFVFPLKWALTILPPTGSLTNLIKGGHAKIKTKKPITIYYHPNWI